MEERRKHKRLLVGEKTSIDNQENGDCFLVDISPGGMKILLDKEIKTGGSVSGQFKILPNAGPFYVKGIVTWVRPLKENTEKTSYEVGVKFTAINTIPF